MGTVFIPFRLCGIKSGIHTTFLARSCGLYYPLPTRFSNQNNQNPGKTREKENTVCKPLMQLQVATADGKGLCNLQPGPRQDGVVPRGRDTP